MFRVNLSFLVTIVKRFGQNISRDKILDFLFFFVIIAGLIFLIMSLLLYCLYLWYNLSNRSFILCV